MRTITIYQLKEDDPGIFMGTDEAECTVKDGKVDRSRYDRVYECWRPNHTTPDDIFYEFNMMIPKDFKGHSLSVSDLVKIKTRTDEKLYFVDSIGFEECEFNDI